MSDIFVSIASYRDPDLINTVKSCYYNAKNKNNLFFSIVFQGDDNECPDLSFIPKNQINFIKYHWSDSRGACWARSIASQNIEQNYFLQIDSHSRFVLNWDELIINNYENSKTFWGSRIILTNYPDMFVIDWNVNPASDVFKSFSSLKSVNVVWNKKNIMPESQNEWPDVLDTINGDEHGFFSAGSVFCLSNLIKEIPYDKNLYFLGEEASMAIRAYTRGIRLVSPVVKYMFSNYDRNNSKRQLHWEDHKNWNDLNSKSYERLSLIMSGNKSLGVFGIDSYSLYEQYKKITGYYMS